MAPPSYTDYVKILAFYKMNIPKSKRRAKLDAEAILGRKLCRCIKSVTKSKRKYREGAAIAICRKSVLQRKGVSNNRFTCKKRYSLLPGKNGDILKKIVPRVTPKKTTRRNVRTTEPKNV